MISRVYTQSPDTLQKALTSILEGKGTGMPCSWCLNSHVVRLLAWQLERAPYWHLCVPSAHS